MALAKPGSNLIPETLYKMKPISILLIELVDNKPAFLRISTAFQEKHDDVNATGDGTKALNHTQDPCPEDIFHNLDMPDLSGPEIIRNLRVELPEAGIVAMAVLDTDNNRWAALRAGVGNSDPKAALSTDRLADK